MSAGPHAAAEEPVNGKPPPPVEIGGDNGVVGDEGTEEAVDVNLCLG